MPTTTDLSATTHVMTRRQRRERSAAAGVPSPVSRPSRVVDMHGPVTAARRLRPARADVLGGGGLVGRFGLCPIVG